MRNKIRMLIMDVDGTLTDGKIYIGNDGEVSKAFYAKDGMAIINLMKNNIVPVFLTGRKSPIAEYRAKELGVQEIYQGISDKTKILNELCEKYNISYDNMAYIGDDIQDLSAIKLVGVSFAPSNASDSVLEAVDNILSKKGGEGAVKEACEFILKYKEDIHKEYLDIVDEENNLTEKRDIIHEKGLWR